MNRREFINCVGVGALATSLPVAIAACGSEPTSTADEESGAETTGGIVTREDGFAAIGTVADLDAAGFIANVRFQGKRVIVIKDPADASSVLAFDAVCPHAACTVTWKESLFDCDCHGSQFNADGTVSAGPSPEPLGSFEAKIEDEQVWVKV
ncbi:MAG: Rieske 2Fe-2S domain-containing protein [Elainellaceae cyanobacterium]